jgi:hypothetical protein
MGIVTLSHDEYIEVGEGVRVKPSGVSEGEEAVSASPGFS